ncbi:hypothetical protein [Martelella mediterranea]|uniref:Uncharacterized protein n=1 Tax=Martelella mediterranea TaxID=293089 RepID=A0A4R3P1G1_9HYPH|nr:hypothetical protein [Martelella mediterranea]TCT40221.1 hypothetical protein EDC90_101073 [Martelella mediterranea]
MARHFDPKEGRPVKYPGEDDYPQNRREPPVVSPTAKRHLDRGQLVIAIFVAIIVALILIWGGIEWFGGQAA